MFLAAKGGQHSIAEIASQYAISKNHLMKIAQRLVAEGFISSVRGRNGGLVLAMQPREINVGKVVRSLEDRSHMVECFNRSTNECVIVSACGLKQALSGAAEAFNKHLDKYTVAELIGDSENFASLFPELV